jgi:hypothetical protein
MVEDSFFAEKLKDFIMAMKEQVEKAEIFMGKWKLKRFCLSSGISGLKRRNLHRKMENLKIWPCL